MIYTSKQLSSQFNKQHGHVLRDIRKLVDQTDLVFEEGVENNTQNKPMPIYTMDEPTYTFMCEKYQGLARIPMRLQEEAALKTIEQLLGVTLLRQFSILGGKYRIDGYDAENNVAYEIDEPHHSQQVDADLERQAEIEMLLGCTFKRIKL